MHWSFWNPWSWSAFNIIFKSASQYLGKSLHTNILCWWNPKISYSFLYFNRHFTFGSSFSRFFSGTSSVHRSSVPCNVCKNIDYFIYLMKSLKSFAWSQILIFFFLFKLIFCNEFHKEVIWPTWMKTIALWNAYLVLIKTGQSHQTIHHKINTHNMDWKLIKRQNSQVK